VWETQELTSAGPGPPSAPPQADCLHRLIPAAPRLPRPFVFIWPPLGPGANVPVIAPLSGSGASSFVSQHEHSAVIVTDGALCAGPATTRPEGPRTGLITGPAQAVSM
jgi:hypothetical protein